jgi:hypothetical protein
LLSIIDFFPFTKNKQTTAMRTLCSLLTLTAAFAETPKDILRFTNGDQLHGIYQGIGENSSILWNRDDLAAPLSLKAENVRHIVLGEASAQKQAAAAEHSYVTLSNGDQIPGEIVKLDETSISMRGAVTGEITLPLSSIAEICPNPFGGKLLYAGPFSPEGWEVFEFTKADKEEEAAVAAAAKAAGLPGPAKDKDVKVKEEPKKEKPAWQHTGAAWYHLEGAQPLVRKDCLGESTSIRFRLAWRERLGVNIAMHCDFSKAPEPKKDDPADQAGGPAKKAPIALGGLNLNRGQVFINGNSQNQSLVFGNALVLNIYSTYFSLSRCGFDANGVPIMQRMMHTQSSVRLPESGDATFELRSDRKSGLLMLFINGEYAAQWEELDPLKANDTTPENKDDAEKKDPPLGNGFGIQAITGNTPIRLTDMVISEWNGVKDSAYSMNNEHRDIVLLTNGTDRYSGDVVGINNGKLHFKSAYSELDIPLQEISEISFAKKAEQEKSEAPQNTVTARFYPVGKISGVMQVSDRKTLNIQHATASKIAIDLSTSISLEFSDENPFLEALDEKEKEDLVPDK